VRGAGWGLLVATPLVIGVTVLLAVISYHDVPTRGGVPVPQMRYVPPVFFSLVSIVLVLAVINLAGRRVVVSVVGDKLWLEGTQPLVGTKRGEWKRSQLFAVCAGPHRRLEVHSRNRPPFTLFYPGPGLELEWLASVLRGALQLETAPASPGAAGTSRRATASASVAGTRWIAPGSEADDDRIEIIAALVAAFLAIPGWFVFYRGASLQDLGWLWSSLWLNILAGAALGLGGAVLYRASRRRYVRGLAEVSRSMNFTFQPEMSREDIGHFFHLRLFREYDSSARNRMTGSVAGVPVDMFDYTFAAGPDQKKQRYRQTIMLLPAPAGLPAFELRPRRRRYWFVSGEISFLEDRPDYQGLRKRLGRDGYQRFLRDYARARPVRESIQRFGRCYAVHKYYLSEYFEHAAPWRSTGQADTGLGSDRPAREEDIRALFTLDVLGYFAARPGWRIESDGVHLAMWRCQGLLSPARRPHVIAEALEVYRLLAHAGTTPASAPSQAV
jgi:hypothetical protein